MSLPPWRDGVLGILLLATLLMPVSYRAGTGHEHPHTIFQGLIDTIAGHPHRHARDPGPTAAGFRGTLSPFASAAIPLSALAGASGAEAGEPALPGPDAPTLLGLSIPVSPLSAIQSLGLLIAALLAGGAIRPMWAGAARPPVRVFTEDPPPPRPA